MTTINYTPETYIVTSPLYYIDINDLYDFVDKNDADQLRSKFYNESNNSITFPINTRLSFEFDDMYYKYAYIIDNNNNHIIDFAIPFNHCNWLDNLENLTTIQ